MFVAVAFLLVGMYFGGKKLDEYRWNNGQCRKCWGFWYAYDTNDTRSVRGYKCDHGHYILISLIDEKPLDPKNILKRTLKVKVGDKIYDSSKEPVMVILTNNDKYNIVHMPKDYKKYCCYPAGLDEDKIKEFMKVEII